MSKWNIFRLLAVDMMNDFLLIAWSEKCEQSSRVVWSLSWLFVKWIVCLNYVWILTLSLNKQSISQIAIRDIKQLCYRSHFFSDHAISKQSFIKKSKNVTSKFILLRLLCNNSTLVITSSYATILQVICNWFSTLLLWTTKNIIDSFLPLWRADWQWYIDNPAYQARTCPI